MDIPELVKNIHKSGWKGVLAIAGGGAGAIDDLLNRGGGSAFLLEAVVPYGQKAFEAYIGKTPEKFVSQTAARQLAMASYFRALKYTDGGQSVIGIGASCALAKAGEREGREHRICVAFQTRWTTCSASFKLPHLGREHEEKFAAHIILRMLGDGVRVTERGWLHSEGIDKSLLESLNEVHASYEMTQLLHKEITHWFPKPIQMVQNPVIFPGSFNPLHDGHIELANIVRAETGKDVIFEMSVTTVDKPPLDYVTMTERMKQFDGNLVLTSVSRYFEKSGIFPGASIICGIDSWDRTVNPVFYNNSESEMHSALQKMRLAGVKFIVFPRIVDGKLKELIADKNSWGLAYPAPKMPENVGISSTQIRAASRHD